jgi:DNA-binding response OmpR family regulator
VGVRAEPCAPEHRAQPREQLLDAEGLGEIVVFSSVPIIIPTALGEEQDKVHGFDLGALAHPL